MNSVWAPAALAALTGSMVALPLTPAVLEMIRRKDAGPLPARKDDGNIRNFARSMRRYIAPLRDPLASCAQSGAVQESRLRDGSYALLAGRGGDYGAPEEKVQTLILFAQSVSLNHRMVFLKDLYAADNLFGGGQNIFRAVLGEKDVFLGEETLVARWLHAEGSVFAGRKSSLHGRLSAETAAILSAGCKFERVCAPVIETSANALQRRGKYTENAIREFPVQHGKLGRSRIRGDIHFHPGEMFLGNIIATGAVRIDEKTRILGSVKAGTHIRLGDGAEVEGSLVSSGTIDIASECLVRGPVLADKEIVIASRVQIGAPDSPATVSAPRISISPGSRVYGTLWARVEGTVEE
ncbi:MAG TPA: hypothetical protein VKT33_11455 [Candidatus Angelobacter sp.]|nr:hypothetical protein [Candidatus Angelobacter sp.]